MIVFTAKRCVRSASPADRNILLKNSSESFDKLLRTNGKKVEIVEKRPAHAEPFNEAQDTPVEAFLRFFGEM